MKFFKKKTKAELLQLEYEKAMKEYQVLSTTDRGASEAKYVEAMALLSELDILNAAEK